MTHGNPEDEAIVQRGAMPPPGGDGDPLRSRTVNGVREALAAATQRLRGDSARADAEILLAHVMNRPRAWLHAHADDAIGDADIAHYDSLVARRAAGQPIAYLTGVREFWSMTLAITPDVLIPRPETEHLVELGLRRLARDAGARIVDLGTGSGAIALALAHERPKAQVLGTDVNEAALVVARGNARRLGITNVDFEHGDWFQSLQGRRFELILSNPPYVADDDPHLDEGDAHHEPRLALAGGADGLDAIRAIVSAARAHLEPDGWVLLEHGYAQGPAVRELLALAGFADVFSEKDLAGQERVSGGRAG